MPDGHQVPSFRYIRDRYKLKDRDDLWEINVNVYRGNVSELRSRKIITVTSEEGKEQNIATFGVL